MRPFVATPLVERTKPLPVWQLLWDERGLGSLRNVPLSRPTLTLLAALWLVALGNFPFWRSVWQASGGLRADNILFLLSLPLSVLAWVYLLLSLMAWGRATKALLSAVHLGAAHSQGL